MVVWIDILRAVGALSGLIVTTEWLTGTGLRTVLYWQLDEKTNFCKAGQGDIHSNLTLKKKRKIMKSFTFKVTYQKIHLVIIRTQTSKISSSLL